MKILGIESSGNVASAAVWKDGEILSEMTGPFHVTHSETLMPLISEALGAAKLGIGDVDLVAVSGGPGSFTGLRIGSATAKGLCFAGKKELVHVPTLDGMAMNFAGSDKLIVPMMDARRGQVYTGIYEFEGDTLKVLEGAMAVSLEELLEKLNANYVSKKVIFLGDAIFPANTTSDAATAKETIEKNCKLAFSFADEDKCLQKASSVAKLGAVLAGEGKAIDAAFEAPEYLRPSQAERVRAEQENK